MKKLHLTLLGATMLCATPSLAEEINNGTNPTSRQINPVRAAPGP